MVSSNWNWKTFDDVEMVGEAWVPTGDSKASVVLVHGLGEHVGRYAHVGATLTEKGFGLYGFDLRGHGKSGGARGHIPSYDALMEDLNLFVHQVEQRHAGLPCFLYGHSLGGNIVLNFALRRNPDLRGVIATGPWLKLAFEPPAIQVALGRVMNRIAPGFTQGNNLNTKALSRDPAVVNAYENDPLVHDRITARHFVEMYEAGLWALDHAAEFPLPLLLMHGSDDQICSPIASQEFGKKVGDKATFKLWDGLYHEIHNEPEQVQVIGFMIAWLEKMLA
jgi:alpha-beta hydrolase superfamily lysophospholipase